MSDNITKLHNGPLLVKEVNGDLIAMLEDMLMRARAGEIVGCAAASLTYDRMGTWDIAGNTFSYAIVGANESVKMELFKRLGEVPEMEEDL